MSTETKSETTKEEQAKTEPVPTSRPFYKHPAFYMIMIAILILIIVAFIVYFTLSQTGGPGLGGTVVGFYVFALILLFIGTIWAAAS